MACPPKGGIYPANGPHRGQYTSHCTTLSLSFFVHPSLAVLQFVSLFLSVFLFFAALPSSSAPVCRLPSSRFHSQRHNSPWQITTIIETKTTVFDACFLFLSRQKWLEAYKSDCLAKEALWISASCTSFDHLFRLLVDLSFFLGGGAGEGWANENIYYDFFAWGFVFEKINFKN